MSDFDKSQYMEDDRGALVPIHMVKEIDLLRDELVKEIVKRSIEVNKILDDFKQKSMADIAAFVSLSAEKYACKIGGEKGNIQLLSYNGKYRVTRTISDYLIFDERLQVAKKLIDECVVEWSQNSRDEIKVIINHAFEVDKAGKINTERVLGLRRLNITDAKWMRAMEAISDSIKIAGSKAYLRVYRRAENGKYDQINLDIAAI